MPHVMIELMSPVRSWSAAAAVSRHRNAERLSLVKSYHKNAEYKDCDKDANRLLGNARPFFLCELPSVTRYRLCF